ncbi:universal stress protein UspA [Haloarcula mannanilytica]|uniref:Universal stress protein UspA n=1 Tax=Haloarcula mannanilytica TaxID=2509225 RepID=A0A4C2EF87_9EURY|nr:HPP family protein [Haloarcula mannanilytica]GCF13044.1 universal stress protein UspA [Haloarcula mannanilytica]
MLDQLRARLRAAARRLRRVERRELQDFRRWAEVTENLVHLSMLVFVPLAIVLVTTLANAVPQLSFLLFPPLAAGSYTLFVDPTSKYSDPKRFVAGLTIGAVCGLGALAVSNSYLTPPGGQFAVNALGAGLAVFATGVVTWPLDIEEPSSYSTALLALLVEPNQRAAFVVSIFLASSLVAVIFVVWREEFYEQRATYLYESMSGDDHVLVPMRGESAGQTAMLGARLAAAHEAGKVVLLDMVSDTETAATEQSLMRETIQLDIRSENGSDAPPARTRIAADGGEPTDATETAGQHNLEAQVDWLETHAARIETRTGVSCQVVVASDDGSPAATTLRTARETNCDLIVAPYESRHGALTPYLQRLFRSENDIVVHRSRGDRTRWKQVLVPVRSVSDVAHNMVDFATRLAGRSGRVAVATCIGSGGDRRRAEEMLADLIEPYEGAFETRVPRTDIQTFLADTGPQYDLVMIGASRDRSKASRFISPPTFERLEDVETDVAIVDRGRA